MVQDATETVETFGGKKSNNAKIPVFTRAKYVIVTLEL